MGWKTSLIIIENPGNLQADKILLQALGKDDFQFSGEVSLSDSLYPKDGSISIGYYKGNIIIADDYQVTNESLEKARGLALTREETALTKLFPESEIVMVACHSVVNYHGYALIRKGKKERLKVISSEEPRRQWGERTAEEQALYDTSIQRAGKNYWKSQSGSGEYQEDQLMEDFTFGFAKRRLGVLLDHAEADELKDSVVFKKYINPKHKDAPEQPAEGKSKMRQWIIYGVILAMLIAWRFFKRTLQD